MAHDTEQPTTAASDVDGPAASATDRDKPTQRDILRTRRIHIGLGLAITAVSAWMLYRSATELPYYADNGQAGPGYLPVLLTVCLIGLGLALTVVWGFGPRARSGEAPILTFDRNQITRALTVWLALLIYTALLDPFGFLIGGEVLMLLIIVAVERMRSIPSIVTLLLLPPVFYFLFQVLLEVQLPVGTLWQ